MTPSLPSSQGWTPSTSGRILNCCSKPELYVPISNRKTNNFRLIPSYPHVQPDLIKIAVFFWYLVKVTCPVYATVHAYTGLYLNPGPGIWLVLCMTNRTIYRFLSSLKLFNAVMLFWSPCTCEEEEHLCLCEGFAEALPFADGEGDEVGVRGHRPATVQEPGRVERLQSRNRLY